MPSVAPMSARPACVARVAATAQGPAKTLPAAPLRSRRALLGLSLGLAGAALAAPAPSLAFGKGFPGYDINEEARARASQSIKEENDRIREKDMASRGGNVEDPAEALIRQMAEQRAKKAAAAAAAGGAQ